VSGVEPGRTLTSSPNSTVRRNVLANYAGRVYSMSATYLFVPFYVSALGIEAYGVIAFYAVLLAITALADVGLSATFSREAAQQKEPADLLGLLAAAERVLILGVSLCACLIFIGAEWLATEWLKTGRDLAPADLVWPLRLMALMLVPQLLVTLYMAGLLGLERQVQANALQSLFITVRSGLIIPLIFSRPDLEIFFAWQLAVTLIFAGLMRVALVRGMGLPAFARSSSNLKVLKPHLSYAAGLATITVISSVNTQLDKAVVSRSFSLGDFGYYNLASTLAQLPIAAALPVAVAYFPKIVSSVARADEKASARVLIDCERLIAFVAALGGFGLALFASELMEVWLQSSRIPAVISQVAAILAVGSFIMCLNMPPYYLCLAHGKSWLVVAVSAATLIMSVPATFVALDALGLIGGALIWLLLNAVQFCLLAAAVTRPPIKTRYLTLLRAAAKPVLLALSGLILARTVASLLDADALWAIAIAGCGAALAIGSFGRLYWREGVWDETRTLDSCRGEP
jgi:O-antigen/teichoic acid export membrane protein